MKYVGIETQRSRNNFHSLLLLILFPCLVVGLVLFASYLFVSFVYNDPEYRIDTWAVTMDIFRGFAPFAIAGVFVWFIIAYFANSSIIRSATASYTLERKENKRVYNLVENLCMSQGMKMPKVNIIDDDSLNAFASGINDRTYTVTLTRGIINKLDDEELEGVIAHELAHIKNRDVRLLIVSIVFVGIFAMLAQMSFQMLRGVSLSSGSRREKGGGVIVIVLIAIIVAAIGYLFSTLLRFAISRKREYLADAEGAQMTKKPYALASALRRISADPNVEAITREDVAQLFIEHPGSQAKGFLSGLSGIFATHPPIESRIKILEQF